MPYNEWGDQDPKYEALKAYYEASTSSDEWSGVRLAEASERLKEIEEAESWNNMGGS